MVFGEKSYKQQFATKGSHRKFSNTTVEKKESIGRERGATQWEQGHTSRGLTEKGGKREYIDPE